MLLAGNVMIFLEPGTEGQVLAGLAARLAPGGLLVAGFSVRADRLTLERYDRLADDAGLQPGVPVGDVGRRTVRRRRLRRLGAPADPFVGNVTRIWTSADGVR